MFDYFFQKVGSTWATWDDVIDKMASIPANAKVHVHRMCVCECVFILQYMLSNRT